MPEDIAASAPRGAGPGGRFIETPSAASWKGNDSGLEVEGVAMKRVAMQVRAAGVGHWHPLPGTAKAIRIVPNPRHRAPRTCGGEGDHPQGRPSRKFGNCFGFDPDRLRGMREAAFSVAQIAQYHGCIGRPSHPPAMGPGTHPGGPWSPYAGSGLPMRWGGPASPPGAPTRTWADIDDAHEDEETGEGG